MITHFMTAGSRKTLEARKDELLTAAIREFAAHGLDAASTAAIAKAVGISQPYLFKIWEAKTSLFLAALDRVYTTVIGTFQAEAAGKPVSVETLTEVGNAYDRLSRVEMQMLLQGFAACDHPEIRDLVERRWMELIGALKTIAGTGGDPIQHFLGVGLLMTVVRTARMPDSALIC
ncbi:MAG: TetR/AcrR family transcriptional regulator [Rhodobacter sp.]|nr:TetR/AcrR family transcriptional regulator [Rhodobacter sp.]MCA3511778.1 TetR/AcrR family transcriptional regulator [Rhodobacter sp.]MCA3521224.1 TetR/AcrR family transcriptional regulator [Rhodobacter sp.]MCA3522239.1 TetR/AcrR family transcriptional regulator [Rhodobacter sp.]MCA3526817.1 TetR/AcrR family transcriptional regulator [Rhodobacter sp.]